MTSADSAAVAGGALRSPSRDSAQLAAVGIALVAVTAAGPHLHLAFGGMAHWAVVAITAAGAGWAGVFGARRVDGTPALLIVGATAVAMRLSLLISDPYLSDDIYRYVWDGRVLASGINPYRYVPADPALMALRDAEIFPFINRADYAPTIYPPVAQAFFFVVTRLGESTLVMRLGLLLAEALTIVCVWSLLRRLELPTTRLAIVAWHPLPVWEIAGSGHIDALMVALLMISVLSFLAGRPWVAAIAATLAALVKPTALLALPLYWRPWNIQIPLIVLAIIVMCYLPFLSVGWKALGFLPGYLAEEELSHGTGFRYLMAIERLFGPVPAGAKIYAALAACVLLSLAISAACRKERSAAETVRWLAILLTAFLVLLTPHYPWYYLPLVTLLAFYPTSWTLWLLTVGGFQVYQIVPGEIMPSFGDRQIAFHGAVLLTLCRDIVRFSNSNKRTANGEKVP